MFCYVFLCMANNHPCKVRQVVACQMLPPPNLRLRVLRPWVGEREIESLKGGASGGDGSNWRHIANG